jgi:hypothetical protein
MVSVVGARHPGDAAGLGPCSRFARRSRSGFAVRTAGHAQRTSGAHACRVGPTSAAPNRPHGRAASAGATEPLRRAKSNRGSRGGHLGDAANVQYLLIDTNQIICACDNASPADLSPATATSFAVRQRCLGDADASSAPTARFAASPASTSRVRHSTRSSRPQDQRSNARSCVLSARTGTPRGAGAARPGRH